MAANIRYLTNKLKPSGTIPQVNKRLQTELKNMMMSQVPDISAFPEGENLFKWIASIKGVDGTVYENLEFKLRIEFPSDYPFNAPNVIFDTPCFHPNVDQNGQICLDILKENWSPVQNISSVLLSIQALLGDPNPESPLNSHAAALWQDQDEYRKAVMSRYHEFS